MGSDEENVTKIKCSICGKETPDYTLLEHNEATKYDYGEMFIANGVMVKTTYYLCDGHAAMVEDIIKRKMEENK